MTTAKPANVTTTTRVQTHLTTNAVRIIRFEAAGKSNKKAIRHIADSIAVYPANPTLDNRSSPKRVTTSGSVNSRAAIVWRTRTPRGTGVPDRDKDWSIKI